MTQCLLIKKIFSSRLWQICNEVTYPNLNALLYYFQSCDLSLITIHKLDCRNFTEIHISQGSVATYLRCGGILKCEFVANLSLSLPVKEFWKSVNVWERYGQEFGVLFFDSRCRVCELISQSKALFSVEQNVTGYNFTIKDSTIRTIDST